MKLLPLFLSLFILMSCSNATLERELEETKAKLAEVEKALADERDEDEIESPLVHVVYFKLKSDADQISFIHELKKLKDIEVIQDLEIGTFKDLGDKRALSEFQVMMSMEFSTEEDYKTYQTHKIHLASKENTKGFLAAPPTSYDYMEQ